MPGIYRLMCVVNSDQYEEFVWYSTKVTKLPDGEGMIPSYELENQLTGHVAHVTASTKTGRLTNLQIETTMPRMEGVPFIYNNTEYVTKVGKNITKGLPSSDSQAGKETSFRSEILETLDRMCCIELACPVTAAELPMAASKFKTDLMAMDSDFWDQGQVVIFDINF